MPDAATVRVSKRSAPVLFLTHSRPRYTPDHEGIFRFWVHLVLLLTPSRGVY